MRLMSTCTTYEDFLLIEMFCSQCLEKNIIVPTNITTMWGNFFVISLLKYDHNIINVICFRHITCAVAHAQRQRSKEESEDRTFNFDSNVKHCKIRLILSQLCVFNQSEAAVVGGYIWTITYSKWIITCHYNSPPTFLYLAWFAVLWHVFVLAVPRYPLDLVNLFIAVSLQVNTS